MTVEVPIPKLSLRPITTGANSAMNQSKLQAITGTLFKAWENSRVKGAIGFDFASHRLKNWCEIFRPTTKRSNRKRIITLHSHLKIAL